MRKKWLFVWVQIHIRQIGVYPPRWTTYEVKTRHVVAMKHNEEEESGQ